MEIELKFFSFYSVCTSIFVLVLISTTAVFGKTSGQSPTTGAVKKFSETVEFLRVKDLEKSTQFQPTVNFIQAVDLEQTKPVSRKLDDQFPINEQKFEFLRIKDLEKSAQFQSTVNFIQAVDLEQAKPISRKFDDQFPINEQKIEFLRIKDLEKPIPPETFNKPLNIAESPPSANSLIPPIDPKSVAAQWGILPIGILVDGRMVVKSALVRGTEDGSQAIQFDDWLIPYEVMIKALNIRVTNLPNGQVQLRSPTVVFDLDFSRLRLDPEIGAVLSIRDVKDWFGITPEFDIDNYAIQIKYPRTNQSDLSKATVEPPIDLTNIPYIFAPSFTVTTINNEESGQSFRSRATRNRTLTSSGSLLGGAWLLSLNETQTENENSWRLGSASYTLQKDSTDLFVGSQSPFWRSTSSNPFWGVTTVQRWGLTMPPSNGGSAKIRVQPSRFGQTVRGKAAPGTLVQLLSPYNQKVFAEVLVDESGEYSFNDIILSEVRLLLYAQGKLTSKPEERILQLPIVIGQLPHKASALIVSVGTGRNNSGNNNEFLGSFTDLRGAASYRYGISQELTLGVGGSYEDGFRGLTELFFQPENTPLQITASALTPTPQRDWEINANIRYNPTSKLRVNLATDLQGSRLRINQNILPNLLVFSNFNYDYTANSPFRYNIGTRARLSGQKFFASLTLEWDNVSNLQWNFNVKKGNFELEHFRNDSSTKTKLIYDILDNSTLNEYNSYNSLVLNYQTFAPISSTSSIGNSLLSLSWRFKPNSSKLEIELGYGIGSEGSGFIINFADEIFSGLFLQANYSNIGLGSNADRFRLSLSSCFDFKRGFCLKDSFRARPRVDNGILLKPFFDRNNNGTKEPTEPLILKNSGSLLIVNNKPVFQYRSEVTDNGIIASLKPGIYRLDLDPSGYPLDWFPTKNTAVAIEVVAGGFTEVVIPFARSYTLSGTVTDAKGNVVSGARVEAVSSTSNHRVFSITGSGGMYYLEGLIDRKYNLLINNIPAEPKTIDLSESSEPYQQLNLRVSP
jgi:hypothetical protein